MSDECRNCGGGPAVECADCVQCDTDQIAGLKSQLAKSREAARGSEEIAEIVYGLLSDDDFQPAYDQRNFMCGPALRGGLERIQDVLARARRVLAETGKDDAECLNCEETLSEHPTVVCNNFESRGSERAGEGE